MNRSKYATKLQLKYNLITPLIDNCSVSVTLEFTSDNCYKKYKLFDVTNFILALSAFRLMQQSLSRTTCSMKSLHSVLKLQSNGTKQNHMLQD